MSKIAVVYWSGTGNTQAMAEAVAEGVQKAGAQALLLPVSETDAASVLACDAVAFGCPAMGAEVLEESEFEPFFEQAEAGLSGKKTALFGSYGWGDGQWMRDWADRVAADGGAFDFELTVHSADAGALRLVPRIAVLGVGCRRGIGQQAMEEAFAALLAQSGLCAEAFYKVCSIDLKRDEPGLRAFCAAHGFAFETFSAAQLAAVEGRFSSSGFVQSVTGVDNVCERSAVLGSGGTLYCKKQAGGGVTMAAAMAPFAPDWRWQDE